MKTSEFIARYGILCRVRHIGDFPAPEATDPHHRRHFALTFYFRDADGDWRSETFDHATGPDTDYDNLNRPEALRHVAMDAYHGDTRQCLADESDPPPGMTREQWKAGRRDTRSRCRAWITDHQMWDDFLSLEYDDAATLPGPRTSLGGVPLTDEDIDEFIERTEATERTVGASLPTPRGGR